MAGFYSPTLSTAPAFQWPGLSPAHPQATVIAFAAGGPAEIVSPGIDGFLFRSEAELIDLTERLMQPIAQAERIAVSRAAPRRAGQFSTQAFIDRVRAVAVQARSTDNAVSRQW